MRHFYRCIVLAAAVSAAAPFLHAEVKPSAVESQLKNLRTVPTEKRPAATTQLAKDIATLPAGTQKLSYADALSHLATEGDPGEEALQAVADALSQSLIETPVPAKNDKTPMPYLDLARLERYEHVKVTLSDPLYAKAQQTLVDNRGRYCESGLYPARHEEQEGHFVRAAGQDCSGELLGHMVRAVPVEMATLDALYAYFQPQGLVVLSITDEDPIKVSQFLGMAHYRPMVLLDLAARRISSFTLRGFRTPSSLGVMANCWPWQQTSERSGSFCKCSQRPTCTSSVAARRIS